MFLPAARRDYSGSRGEPSGAKAMGLYLGATPQTESVAHTPEKNATGESSTKDDIETVRLCAFAPPDSPLRSKRCVGFSEHE